MHQHGSLGGPPAALVTGAGRRIGRAFAERLAARGCFVGLHCNASRDEAEEAAAAIRSAGGACAVLRADLAQRADVLRLAADMAALAPGPVTILVNNASLFEQDRADSFTAESWQRHMAVNLEAPVLLAQHLARGLPAGREGVVVNMLDQKLFNLNPDHFTYTLAKAGLLTATRTMAQALRGRVRIAGIAPGLTLPSTRQTPERFAQAFRDTPLGRSSTVPELVAALDFILDTPGYTGEVLVLDGGESLRPRGRDVSFDPALT
ncbi:MAG: SDR family oxidoreductase [Alphaproteobacteria bacterium]|nr:SDR family oxidoreductase [Alphaproteobacteria bacterium]